MGRVKEERERMGGWEQRRRIWHVGYKVRYAVTSWSDPAGVDRPTPPPPPVDCRPVSLIAATKGCGVICKPRSGLWNLLDWSCNAGCSEWSSHAVFLWMTYSPPLTVVALHREELAEKMKHQNSRLWRYASVRLGYRVAFTHNAQWWQWLEKWEILFKMLFK